MIAQDSLPYIDADITQNQRDAATHLINAELPRNYNKKLHPALTEILPTRRSPLLQIEVDRVARGLPMSGGVDSSKYEILDDLDVEADETFLRQALASAYSNITYLQGRKDNIALLEEHGKNSWLIGNSQLDGLHKALERELAAAREESDAINRARRGVQENSQGELIGLEDAWKKGISRIVETQIATARLKR